MSKRGRCDGVLQIVRYNRRFYSAALVGSGVLWRLSRSPKCPRVLRLIGRSLSLLASWWTFASLLASHWVYDRSPLGSWRWVGDVLPDLPQRWVNLHCGLDESSAALHALFPESEGVTFDFFDEATMSEPSIHIARELQKGNNCGNVILANLRDLPCSDNCFDTVFLFFAAHEIRDAKLRRQFFSELHRVLCAGGRVLLVEHPRDFMNFLAFGPGFLHFWPRAEWRSIASEAGFSIAKEFSMTPFVRVWVLQKEQA